MARFSLVRALVAVLSAAGLFSVLTTTTYSSLLLLVASNHDQAATDIMRLLPLQRLSLNTTQMQEQPQPPQQPNKVTPKRNRTLLFLRSHQGQDSFTCNMNTLWGPDVDAEFIAEILHDFQHYSMNRTKVRSARPQNWNIDVLAYSSNKYNVKDVQYVTNKFKPKVLLHLSDEEGKKASHEQELFPQYRLVYRQYRYENQKFHNPANQRILPLGYHCWDQHVAPNNATRTLPAKRKYLWSFIGTMDKGDRLAMALALNGAGLTPNFFGAANNTVENANIFANSRFVICPRGNVNVETFRMYMASRSGAIPITIMSQDDWNATIAHLDIPPPWFRVDNVQGAIDLMKHLERQPPEVVVQAQQRVLQWWDDIKTEIRRNIVQAIDNHV